MAKKITDNEGGAVENPDLQPENPDQPTPAPEPSQETPATPVPEPEPKKKADKKETAQVIPDYADRILRTLTSYPELYIDQHGGTFTVDSPPAFHSTATRYTNPYFKQP